MMVKVTNLIKIITNISIELNIIRTSKKGKNIIVIIRKCLNSKKNIL